MQPDLPFAPVGPTRIAVAPGVVLLRGFAATAGLVAGIDGIARRAPFRQLETPGGGRMSVAMTNAGPVGWHSDANGYRYVERDPLTDEPWPAIPARFAELARSAAAAAGFPSFEPDCVLVNRYRPGSQMGTHRDHDERDLGHPIVSVSIGLPATFVWHGTTRRNPPQPVPVVDGDVLVWGGEARGGYHGVRRLRPGGDPDALRYNLTFRRAR